MSVRLLACLLAPLPALANGADCGGDAVSSAVVAEGRPSRPGPLTSVPDTLCADLSDTTRPRLRLDLYAPLDGADGGTGSATPYDGREPRIGPRRRGDGSR
ncbi:hypothetical protein [Methylobacterium sp. ID0610]|uniref:hypothetical protein n=1 Tax=Methylobacterium carpenticola TaxID=3344827 RepID=UPI00368BB361